MQKIAVSSFVKRQIPDSEFSHFDGTWDELLDIVKDVISSSALNSIDVIETPATIKPGYRNGVVLVEVPPDKFYTSVVELVDGDTFKGEYKPRQLGEEPRRSIFVNRKNTEKQKAAAVDIVLYRYDVLAENDENSSDAEWEIISINARPTLEEQPIEVGTLIHNHFQSSGGTKTNMTNDEFVAALEKSFKYWKNKGKIKPSENNN